MVIEKLKEHRIIYELHVGAMLEPFYYWILDFLRVNLKYKVVKGADYYNISSRAPEFSSMLQAIHLSVSDASSLLQQIGVILKGIVAMKQDYQRIKECLDYYEKAKKPPGELVLKGIWVDFVDTKTGAASIAQVTRSLPFYTVRDWFFRVDSEKDIDKLPTNERVKNFLKRKLREYKTWKKMWYESLKEMLEIIEERIRASTETVNLYKEWVKPFIRNVQRLQMRVEPISPELITVGGNIYAVVELLAYKGFDETTLRCEYGRWVPCIELQFLIRGSSPPGRYVRTELLMRAVLMDIETFLKQLDEWKKDPVEEWFKKLMLTYKFSAERKKLEKEKKGKEKGKEEESLYEKWKKRRAWTLFYKLSGADYRDKKRATEVLIGSPESPGGDLFTLYDILKKAFGMLSWR